MRDDVFRSLIGLCLLGGMLMHPASARELLYIEAAGSKDVRVVDAWTFLPVATIAIGEPTDDIVGSPDGRFAYGNALSGGSQPGAGFVYCISTASNQVIWNIPITGMPQHLAVSRDGTRLFVPVFDRDEIYVVDTSAARVMDVWRGARGNHGSELSADGRHLYVGNMITNRIYVYDVRTGRMMHSYRVRDAVRPFKIDHQEARLYYQLSNYHGFGVLNLRSGQPEQAVDLPPLEPGLHPGAYGTLDHGMALTPDGSRLIVAGSVAGYVALYGLPDLRLLSTIDVGKDANWIRVRSDSKVAYVTNRGSNDLSVIDLDGHKELARIPVGSEPARFDIIDVR